MVPIIDVVTSKITGIDAAIEICKALPNCKVLLLSGNDRAIDLLKDANERGHDFEILPKPVHPSVIIDRLSEMRSEFKLAALPEKPSPFHRLNSASLLSVRRCVALLSSSCQGL